MELVKLVDLRTVRGDSIKEEESDTYAKISVITGNTLVDVYEIYDRETNKDMREYKKLLKKVKKTCIK